MKQNSFDSTKNASVEKGTTHVRICSSVKVRKPSPP